VTDGITRQIPSRVSKKSVFLKARLFRKSKTYESTFGRTASIKSHAKESRDL